MRFKLPPSLAGVELNQTGSSGLHEELSDSFHLLSFPSCSPQEKTSSLRGLWEVHPIVLSHQTPTDRFSGHLQDRCYTAGLRFRLPSDGDQLHAGSFRLVSGLFPVGFRFVSG